MFEAWSREIASKKTQMATVKLLRSKCETYLSNSASAPPFSSPIPSPMIVSERDRAIEPGIGAKERVCDLEGALENRSWSNVPIVLTFTHH